MGWDLSVGSIERNMGGTSAWAGTSYTDYDDTFTLNLNGQSWLLLKIADLAGGIKEYRTTDESFLRIYQYTSTTPYWMVWDKNGNVYKFGDNTDLTKQARQYICKGEHYGEMYNVTWKWGLSEVRNAFYDPNLGNSIKFNYSFETHHHECDLYYETGYQTWDSYPNWVDSDTAMYPARSSTQIAGTGSNSHCYQTVLITIPGG